MGIKLNGKNGSVFAYLSGYNIIVKMSNGVSAQAPVNSNSEIRELAEFIQQQIDGKTTKAGINIILH